MKPIKGNAWVFGDHVNTDQIIPTKYMLLTSKAEMARHTFETLEPDFYQRVKPGDIIVAGVNFGCGSAREQAVEVLKELKIGAVVASSFNMTFFRNSINLGIPAIVCDGICGCIKNGDVLSIDIEAGVIEVAGSASSYKIEPFSDIVKDIIKCSGLVNYYFKKRKGKSV